MSGVNLVQLTRGTAANTYVTEADDREFNILISTGSGATLVRYSKTVAAQALSTTPITYVIDSRNPQSTTPGENRSLLMRLNVNSERTLLTVALVDIPGVVETVVNVYALRETAEQGGGGTTVVANPATDLNDPTLDSVTIGSEDYRITGNPVTEGSILGAVSSTPTDGQVLTFDGNSNTLVWTTPATGGTGSSSQTISPISNYQEMYNALEEALFSGALTITYSGKTVTYRSTDEMIRIHRMLAQKLGIGKKPRVATMTFKQRSYH